LVPSRPTANIQPAIPDCNARARPQADRGLIGAAECLPPERENRIESKLGDVQCAPKEVASIMPKSKPKSRLQFHVATGQLRALAPNAVLIAGQRDAVLIDTLFVRKDAEDLVRLIQASQKKLKDVFITHAHPDHYFGLPVIQQAFPKARIWARPATIDWMREFRAKLVHWQEMYPGEIPDSIQLPLAYEKNSYELEGNKIALVDLFMVETLEATAFYIPSEKTFVAGDFIYAKAHHYMSDVNSPETWIKAIQEKRKIGAIERVIPGHGPVGGSELFDESIQWLRAYQSVAKPGVRFADIAREMMKRYPHHALPILLWVTRGPGFGLAGAKEAGVPPEVLGA
jgi:glyoxylase-like metal-dependent hydrolase (beta-lactamase superfamily II)